MYFLIGNPLGHSFSAEYFNRKFSREGIPSFYRLCPLESIDCLPELLDSITSEGETPEGFNVTIPYKESIIPYLDILSPEAEEIGAVNVVKVDHRDGLLFLTGYNSDAYGFRESLRRWLRPDMRKALVLGTGGASKAVNFALRSLGITPTGVSRTPHEGMLTYADLTPELMGEYDVIVNATPLGTFPDTDRCPDIPYEGLTSRHVCHDLVYNPSETKFMRLSKAQGATVVNGLEMLHAQAEGAWSIWTGSPLSFSRS